eukprot:CAMPEP_0204339406 /NCGR_PEP_ID=MMETSP0469-20131031/21780_1 /ASSEMBLY_ACC=CAM_ASM_000384 /TAXON_ID=2969 /ORGANISM="Oxyrrhis marina" /LENGTH=31 /DNA_ID= /DNA_START= /DNA_END= /DNA_ORIENTATION=
MAEKLGLDGAALHRTGGAPEDPTRQDNATST